MLSFTFLRVNEWLHCRIANGPTRGQLAMHLRGMLVKLNVVESLLNGNMDGEKRVLCRKMTRLSE